ncbi:MAG: MBOAT family protein, partial [Acidimicrobiales bacterium]|nr:MBOAT family protein [Acidimicrobiales bacterium]
VSYVVDVYRRTLAPARGIDVTVYLSFFPHLVAGPIVRGTELLPQIRRRRNPRDVQYVEACWLIAIGLAKKVVLSSYLATYVVDPVFADPRQHSALEVLFAIYGYAVQIYADFSGYTDMAIGLALLPGFQFPQNFRRPYTAISLQDFWRRWHITLSFWLRDYLYIPLGGNLGPEWRVSVNIILTMLLGGLWHGAAWTFVAWGLYHGVGQVVGRERRRRREALGLPVDPQNRGQLALARFATFQLVCLGWLIFRSDSIGNAAQMLSRLVVGWATASPLVTPLAALAIAVGIGTQYVPEGLFERVKSAFAARRPVLQGGILGLVLVAITTFGPQGVAPFIYYRF